MGLRRLAGSIAGKVAIAALRRVGRAATTAPGRVVLGLDPDFIGSVTGDARRVRTAVTGTNGKTTTAALMESCMRASGWSVVRNSSGANMLPGIASALVERVTAAGRIDVDAVVAEVDEATVPGLVRAMAVDVFVVTNFFRDQLDRYGEMDRTVAYVRRGLENFGGSTCLNADDPLVADLAPSVKADSTVFFGIDPLVDDDEGTDVELAAGVDTQFCPRCGGRFVYTHRVYGHLGDYHCPDCGWSRPRRHVVGRELPGKGTGVALEISFARGESIEVNLAIPGIYNAYNAVAAAAGAHASGVGLDDIRVGLEGFSGAFGRMEVLDIGGRELVLALSKNPVGFDQILGAVVSDDEAAAVVLGINDGHADGRDISWLWDVDFEMLCKRPDIRVSCAGSRAEDMAVRLKYGGIPAEGLRVEGDLASSVDAALEGVVEGRRVYALLTYTALLQLRSGLQRRGLVREMWRG